MFPIKDTQTLGKFPFVTLFIILLNVFIFVEELLSPNPDSFILKYSLIPNQVNFLNVTTLAPFITSQFMHAGFFHIIPNMWFLWVFGPNMEAALGRFKFLIIYLLSGILAAVTQFSLLSGTTVPMIGASGAIAGLLGGYLKLFSDHKIETIIIIVFIPIFVVLPAVLILLFWFFTQVFSGVSEIFTGSATSGGVAFWAHIGGFIGGWLLVTIWGPKKENLVSLEK
jgi:membrane associated rhomboid family serine protease